VNELWEWLLGLESLRFGQENVEFGFARPLPGWGWFLVGVAAVGMALYSYRRLEGTRWVRAALAVTRAAILVLIVLLIAGPRLLKPNETEEKDWVIVVADRSASMTVRDAQATPGSVERRTREAELRSAILNSSATWRSLSEDRVVAWMGFDAQARELKPTQGGDAGTGLPVQLGEPTGRRTALGAALEQSLRKAAARPVSGVVVLTDGRSIDEPGKSVLRRLEAERIPVFAVALGSADPVADVSVRRADGPRNAFVNDFVPVEVELERLGGLGGGPGGEKPKVQLIDTATGAVLDEREVEFLPSAPVTGARTEDGEVQPPAATARVTLTTQAKAEGAQKWQVRVVPGGADLVTENNEADVAVEMLGRPLRLAYFDGYPRWEYRYIKNLLVREKSFKASSMLLSAGRRFVLEGEEIVMSIPRSPEEWREFDVVVMGDVRPEMFTTEQLEQIKEHVALRGAGLIWIGGEGATPGAWRGTPLADLLPFALPELVDRSGTDAGPPAWDEPVTVEPTALAERLGVLRLSPAPVDGSWWPEELRDPRVGWSSLRWAQNIDAATLKPTAEVLAEAVSSRESTEAGPARSPLVIAMRFGAGRTLYVGTDEIWRWRYGRGEFYPERFWLQMMRMLGRESLSRAGKPALVEVLPRRAEVDQPIRIAVTLLDQSLVDAAPASLRVRVVRERDVGPGASASEPAVPIELTLPAEGSGSAAASRAGRAISRTFAATWLATESGRYRIEVTDPLVVGLAPPESLAAEAEVWLPEDELRRPETNHPMLQRLVQVSGGKMLTPAELNDLPRLLPNRRLRLAGEPDVETLWDTPLALILIMTLLTIEWVVRRLIRLA
jgi:hypothetical protein